MVQIIIAIAIIIAAVAAGVFLAVRKVKRLKQPNPCRDCNASCGDCSLYKELQKKGSPRKEKQGERH